MHLHRTSPALVKQLLRDGVQRTLERKMAGQLWSEARPNGRRACFDVVHRLTSPGCRKVDECGKCLIKAVAAGAYWTSQRQRDSGYDVQVQCPLCGAPEDGLIHRLWWCPSLQKERGLSSSLTSSRG